MSRMSVLSNPLLLGFEDIERLLDRITKSGGDSYPPYNIERVPRSANLPERMRITLAVAGFGRDDLEITVEDSQLVVRGNQDSDDDRAFLHRGIATRKFQRTFVLADGIEVRSANLENGLLCIDLVRLETEKVVKRIEIGAG
ncbi:MAG: Hsp20 family protein [Hyphomicrobiaceae bacterium]